MGFGFNLFAVFILFPLTILLGIIWLISRKKLFGKLLAFVWLPIFGLILLVGIMRIFTEKKNLDRQDIYGEYVIDRTKFAGTQADWQYDHYRFEITEKNEFIFYLTEKDKIIKTYKGHVEFLEAYKQPRIIIHTPESSYHLIEEKPTLYRNIWSFYYVFRSPKFGNVFFTKGKWKPINE